MASLAGVMLAVTVVTSPAATAGISAGSNSTFQPCGGVALRATPAPGAGPGLRTSSVSGGGLPGDLDARRLAGVNDRGRGLRRARGPRVDLPARRAGGLQRELPLLARVVLEREIEAIGGGGRG